jgi:hypothetical protein
VRIRLVLDFFKKNRGLTRTIPDYFLNPKEKNPGSEAWQFSAI